MTEPDEISRPHWYRQHPSGVECRTIAREFSFNLGNVIKYVWRAGLKSADPLHDLMKARNYLDDEIARLAARQAKPHPPMKATLMPPRQSDPFVFDPDEDV